MSDFVLSPDNFPKLQLLPGMQKHFLHSYSYKSGVITAPGLLRPQQKNKPALVQFTVGPLSKEAIDRDDPSPLSVHVINNHEAELCVQSFQTTLTDSGWCVVGSVEVKGILKSDGYVQVNKSKLTNTLRLQIVFLDCGTQAILGCSYLSTGFITRSEKEVMQSAEKVDPVEYPPPVCTPEVAEHLHNEIQKYLANAGASTLELDAVEHGTDDEEDDDVEDRVASAVPDPLTTLEGAFRTVKYELNTTNDMDKIRRVLSHTESFIKTLRQKIRNEYPTSSRLDGNKRRASLPLAIEEGSWDTHQLYNENGKRPRPDATSPHSNAKRARRMSLPRIERYDTLTAVPDNRPADVDNSSKRGIDALFEAVGLVGTRAVRQREATMQEAAGEEDVVPREHEKSEADADVLTDDEEPSVIPPTEADMPPNADDVGVAEPLGK